MDRRKILLVVAAVVAALGAGLVFIYADGADERANEDVEMKYVLVAIKTILPGESASDAANAGKLDQRLVPADQALQGSTDRGEDFTDTIALTTIFAGEQLLTQKFGTIEDIEGRPTLPIPEGLGAATFELSADDKVGSFAQPGSHVAVYVTLPVAGAPVTSGEEGDTAVDTAILAPACLIEDDLLVLGVGSTSVSKPVTPENTSTVGQDNAQNEVVGPTLMTTAVNSDQAAVLLGLDRRDIKPIFVLRNDESRLEPTAACQPVVDAIKASLTTPTTATSSNG